ncbi:MAG: hypothetical protein Q8R30_01995 [bacterium]|nr:hypothetical protein [bacterium]MDZ4285542.1 hypothetical protein [Candidatus Sungbacteria bacterium]
MVKLEKVEEELYSKEKEAQENIDERTKWRAFFPRTKSRIPTIWVPEHSPTGAPETPWVRHPWGYFFGSVTLILIMLTGVFVFFYLRLQGQEARVEIQAGDTTESGSIITIPAVYKNVSHTILHEGQIVFTLPPGAFLHEQGVDVPAPTRIVKQVQDLGQGEQGVVEISARLFGQEDEDQKIQVIYYYRPENVSAQFSARGEKTVTIVKVPLAISWEIPQTLARGQDVEIKVHYVLDSALPFQNMALKMEYPSGFAFTSADPKPAVGENIWQLGTIQPGREGIITIHGTVSGEEGEVKAFHSSLGTFNETTKEWRTFNESSKEVAIAVTPVSIQGFLGGVREGVVQPGALLGFVLRYRNNTNSTLKNVTVKAFLEGSILDRVTLKPGNDGVVESQTGAVIWGPGNVAELRKLDPGQSGELGFTISAKDPPPVTSDQDKNLKVMLRSSVSVATIPDELKGTDLSSQDSIAFKVASKVVFSGKALHGASPIPNSGVFPPKVGEKTTYTILWELKNFTNDIANSQVVATLPPNVIWEGLTRADGSSITFDVASGQVRWNIGNLAAGAGVRAPTRTGAFQVSITPSEVDRGKSVILVNESRLTGTDSFTNTSVDQKIKAIDTELRFDPTAKFGDGTVR